MIMRCPAVAVLITIMAACISPSPANAQSIRPSAAESFDLGTGGNLLCRVQSNLSDKALSTMFDRAYSIVCRDAAGPIGTIYALRDRGDPASRLKGLRLDEVDCGDEAPAAVESLDGVTLSRCTLKSAAVDYFVYSVARRDTLFVAEGLAGYDSALRLALRSVVADKVLPGDISVATTGFGDEAAFARIQAGALSVDQALAEAYRRNNSGSYAEASEFFESLLERTLQADDYDAAERAGELLINQALQQSNLGNFEEAESLYNRALAIPSASPTQLRLRRNFRTLHLLNQRQFEAALAVLEESLETSMTPTDEIASAVISDATSQQLNSSDDLFRKLGGTASEKLTVTERATLLDAQAGILRGTLLRIMNRSDAATQPLNDALTRISSVREGRVRSTARLRAQALTELSAIAEASGNQGRAEALLREASDVTALQYPESIASSAAKARLAAFLTRLGRIEEAIVLFEEVVDSNTDQAVEKPGLEYRLFPYFQLLVEEMDTRPELVNQFFRASETLIRPGLANTQSVLARELSSGNDEAARLFRQSLTLSRAIESTRVELGRLQSLGEPDEQTIQRIGTVTGQLEALISDQSATQAKLAGFPRYQALNSKALTLPELQANLRPGEAYIKMFEIAGRIFMIHATLDNAFAYRAAIDAETLENRVFDLRGTISVFLGGEQLTYPFDVRLAHDLFTELLEPVAGRLQAADHLIVEADGAMLQLPPNLLVTDERAVLAYEKRMEDPESDPFDFREIAWLGREKRVSTSVSARSFGFLRNLAASAAQREYIGFGENSLPPVRADLPRANAPFADPAADCRWPDRVWQNPISADELRTAQSILGRGSSTLVTGAAFTDAALMSREDLDEYRIIHFATHGLVTQPSSTCPARPALVTSFGEGRTSDGLLSFSEIFDLRLDADLVILSACDTASSAGLTASREAGLGGGESAFDGLVRAFVGAGSRVVIASQWPAPDDFGATRKLMEGLLGAPRNEALAESMRKAQLRLMNDAETSHPFYWSGFAIIGDGARAIIGGEAGAAGGVQ